MGPRAKSLVKDAIIVGVGLLIIWGALIAVFGTQNPFYVVSSGSMIPALEVYDIIVVQGNHPFEEVQTGDIIVFDRPDGHDRVIVHRVVSVTDDDPYTVRTQGDANPASIPGTDFPITAEEYIGTVEYVIPRIGEITRILSIEIGGIPLNYIIIAAIIAIMIIRQVMDGKEKRPRGRPSDGTGDSGQAGPDGEPVAEEHDKKADPEDGALRGELGPGDEPSVEEPGRDEKGDSETGTHRGEPDPGKTDSAKDDGEEGREPASRS